MIDDTCPNAVSLWTYAGVIAVSGWGGVVAFIQKRRAGVARPFNFIELIGEVTTAGFCGVLTFWLCQAWHVNEWITAAAVGVSGHMGSRGIFLLERILTRRYLPAELLTQPADPSDQGPSA